MVWDDTKTSGDLIKSSDWNSMVSDQKKRILISNPVNGDLVFYNGAWSNLPIGTDGQVLTVANGLPSWADASGGGGSGGGIPYRIVSASDASDESKAKAHYVCDGTDDQSEINQAVADLPASGGIIYLTEGTFNISSPISFGDKPISIIGTPSNEVNNKTSSFLTVSNGTILTGMQGIINVNITADQKYSMKGISFRGRYFITTDMKETHTAYWFFDSCFFSSGVSNTYYHFLEPIPSHTTGYHYLHNKIILFNSRMQNLNFGNSQSYNNLTDLFAFNSSIIGVNDNSHYNTGSMNFYNCFLYTFTPAETSMTLNIYNSVINNSSLLITRFSKINIYSSQLTNAAFYFLNNTHIFDSKLSTVQFHRNSTSDNPILKISGSELSNVTIDSAIKQRIITGGVLNYI